MDDWFHQLATESALSAANAQALDEEGFFIIEGPVPASKLEQLTKAYDQAMREAAVADVGIGRTTTRVNDFVTRGAEFDDLYLHPPVLAACCRAIHQPFKLSNMLGRTLRPKAPAQELHVDFARDGQDWPMVGFIVMIDEFRQENGATRFVPGSHLGSRGVANASGHEPETVSACAPAGSMIVYNGSVLHGHGANETAHPRRAIQGAFIRRDAPGFDLAARMNPETWKRISPLAKYLIGV